ncbi:hypothetical protein PsYK624_097360 [Phanerochaete sordida]|uniref:Uncharacterized protein n=1 Tax=Phanerochaete sordida TaxID=48140 RepID=A0A9P3GD97_9APHY|nr:hypothetical protein PsYK624_097360 [Phanerochaete sordida]
MFNHDLKEKRMPGPVDRPPSANDNPGTSSVEPTASAVLDGSTRRNTKPSTSNAPTDDRQGVIAGGASRLVTSPTVSPPGLSEWEAYKRSSGRGLPISSRTAAEKKVIAPAPAHKKEASAPQAATRKKSRRPCQKCVEEKPVGGADAKAAQPSPNIEATAATGALPPRSPIDAQSNAASTSTSTTTRSAPSPKARASGSESPPAQSGFQFIDCTPGPNCPIASLRNVGKREAPEEDDPQPAPQSEASAPPRKKRRVTPEKAAKNATDAAPAANPTTPCDTKGKGKRAELATVPTTDVHTSSTDSRASSSATTSQDLIFQQKQMFWGTFPTLLLPAVVGQLQPRDFLSPLQDFSYSLIGTSYRPHETAYASSHFAVAGVSSSASTSQDRLPIRTQLVLPARAIGEIDILPLSAAKQASAVDRSGMRDDQDDDYSALFGSDDASFD